MSLLKSNYGDFDTGFDPETFNDFYHWRKNNEGGNNNLTWLSSHRA